MRALLATLLLIPCGAFAQDTVNGCGMKGDARNAAEAQQNALKNRYVATTQINKSIALMSLLSGGKELTSDQAATVTGYCVEVKPGSIESCNCHTKDVSKQDTHIALAPSADSPKYKWVIVEVTPRVRAQNARAGIDWSTKTLKKTLLGRFISVTGSLFSDTEHKQNAFLSNPTGTDVWRGTIWEIHPVFGIQVLK